MAVRFDAQAFKDFAASTGGTWTHSSVGVPAGMAVLIVSNASTADVITSCAYGGGTLTRISSIAGGVASEPGRSYLYFRGTIVAASGTVNVGGTSSTFTCWSVSLTGNPFAELDVAGTATITSTSLANPTGTATVPQGSTGIALGILFSGTAAPGAVTPNAGYVALTGSAAGGVDFGATCGAAAYGTIEAPLTSLAQGWTANADDVGLVVGLVREKPPTVLPPTVNFALGIE